MERKIYLFGPGCNDGCLDDRRVDQWFGPEIRNAMMELLSDAREKDWFTQIALEVPVNQHGLDQPRLYVGVEEENDGSATGTNEILESIKDNQYPGLSYSGYYKQDTPVGLSFVVTPSHKPNHKL